MTTSDIESELKCLKSIEAGTYKNIPCTHIKQTSDICSKSLMKICNTEVVQNKIFHNNLKVADIAQFFEKGDSTLERITDL